VLDPGIDRLIETVRGTNLEDRDEDMSEHLADQFDVAPRAPQFDDMTLVTVKMK
jgi:serine phosphatase RsbU (regulator of sigma subunit)